MRFPQAIVYLVTPGVRAVWAKDSITARVALAHSFSSKVSASELALWVSTRILLLISVKFAIQVYFFL